MSAPQTLSFLTTCLVPCCVLQGTGEANFLGGVARKYGAPFEVESCKKRFFEIYLSKYCVPGIARIFLPISLLTADREMLVSNWWLMEGSMLP